MVLSHPEASAVEDAGVGFAAGAFVADVIVNRKTGNLVFSNGSQADRGHAASDWLPAELAGSI